MSDALQPQQTLDVRDLVGGSLAMAELAGLIVKAAGANSTVLIQGESGTGKELVARAIHRGSPRSAGPFVAVNCAALPESLVESELFGHEKGAFTGAVSQKKGSFELATRGTLFLDEIGELPLGAQVKLLRALQEREIQRVGGTQPVRLDVRLIAATNRDLEAAAANNEFREDLYHRLNVICCRTPALRERREDILVLARHFMFGFARAAGRSVRGISDAAGRLLENYDWPGNVRELQNVIERAVVLGCTDMLLAEDLPDRVRNSSETLPNYLEAVDTTRRNLLEKAFARAGGNCRKAAALIGLRPTYVYKLLNNMNLTHLLRSR
jgi:transcriptional regulator with PAS, ATPase and Fis domain